MRVFLLLLLLPLSLQAQYSKVIEAPGKNTAVLFKYARNFSRSTDRFFISNDRVKDRNWVLGRVKWGNRKKLFLGFYSADTVFKELLDKVIIAYQSKGTCVQLMTLTADMTTRCKAGRTKLTIDNIRYVHYNTGAPPTVLYLSNENFRCGASGTLQELKDCKVCRSAVKQVLEFADESFLGLIREYEDYLQKTIADSDW